MRSFISADALFVKLTARMREGRTPRSIKRWMRMVMTRVFPLPAPARTKSGPRM